MELSNKEKFIKKTLESQNYPLDKEALWHSVQTKLDQNNNERSWFWLVFAGSILLLTSISGNRFYTDHLIPQKQIFSELNSQTENEDKNLSVAHLSAQVDHNDEVMLSPFTENSKANIIQSEPGHSNINNPKHTHARITESGKETSPSLISAWSNNKSEKDKRSTDSPVITSNRYEQVTPGDQSTADLFSDITLNVSKHHSGTNELSLIDRVEKLGTLPMSSLVLPGKPRMEFEFIEPISKLESDFYLIVRSGMNMSLIRNKITSPDVFMPVSEFSNEHSMPSLTTDLIFGKEIKQGWSLFGGLTYNQNVVRYTNTGSLLETGQVNGIESIYEKKDGVVTSHEGLINQNTLTEYDVRWYRKHRSILLSAGIRKAVINVNKVAIYADLALNFQLSATHLGYYFSNIPASFTRIENGEDHIYNGSGKLLIRGGIGVDYKLDRFAIGIHSFYIYNQNSLTGKNNFYQTGISTIGIQMGFTYYPAW